MRVLRIIIVVVTGLLPLALNAAGASAQPAPSTIAFLQAPSSPLAQPDLTVRFADGTPETRVTVDARVVPDAVENVKLPIGWAGTNVLTYATETGQQAGAAPVYAQRIDSVRRALVARDVTNGEPAPSGARVALIGGGPIFIHVVDLTSLRTTAMALPKGSSGMPTVYGGMSVTWSPDGTRLAAVWLASDGAKVGVAVCLVAAARCSVAYHRDDIGLPAISVGKQLLIAWLPPRALLLAVTPGYGSQPSTLVTLPGGNPGARATAALGRFRLARGQVLGLSVSPSGQDAALVETSAYNKPPVLQIAHVVGGKLVPTSIISTLGAGPSGAWPGSFSFAAPSQAWTGRKILYAETFETSSRAAPSADIARLDAGTGQRELVRKATYWGAVQPPGPAVRSISKSQGTCPLAPSAVTFSGRHFGFDRAASVQQTVSYFRELRQQAFRLADGSCLNTVASGPVLSANLAAIAALKSGETAVVPAAIHPGTIRVNVKAGVATETATVDEGESVYRGNRRVRIETEKYSTVVYRLRLTGLGKVNGFPRFRWMVDSVSG